MQLKVRDIPNPSSGLARLSFHIANLDSPASGFFTKAPRARRIGSETFNDVARKQKHIVACSAAREREKEGTGYTSKLSISGEHLVHFSRYETGPKVELQLW